MCDCNQKAEGPAYAYDGKSRVGPGCSGSPDFCFLCEFSVENEHNVGDTNFTREIRELAGQLASEGKELSTIVSAVYRAYEEGARPFVEWVNRAGATIKQPAWTRDSIARHILYSSEFPIFRQTVDHIFHAIIVAEQSKVMDPVTNDVHPDRKKRLLSTISEYGNWLVKRHRVESKDSK